MACTSGVGMGVAGAGVGIAVAGAPGRRREGRRCGWRRRGASGAGSQDDDESRKNGRSRVDALHPANGRPSRVSSTGTNRPRYTRRSTGHRTAPPPPPPPCCARGRVRWGQPSSSPPYSGWRLRLRAAGRLTAQLAAIAITGPCRRADRGPNAVVDALVTESSETDVPIAPCGTCSRSAARPARRQPGVAPRRWRRPPASRPRAGARTDVRPAWPRRPAVGRVASARIGPRRRAASAEGSFRSWRWAAGASSPRAAPSRRARRSRPATRTRRASRRHGHGRTPRPPRRHRVGTRQAPPRPRPASSASSSRSNQAASASSTISRTLRSARAASTFTAR